MRFMVVAASALMLVDCVNGGSFSNSAPHNYIKLTTQYDPRDLFVIAEGKKRYRF